MVCALIIVLLIILSAVVSTHVLAVL